ncbi:MAG: acyl--CoA ligase [Clostridia bacterium]|nr:acyl--CoA ligase [Clostridia bacterium]
MNGNEREQVAKLQKRLKSGELIDQPCWSFIKELNSTSDERLDSIAFRNGYRTYSYRQMFYQWERYASAFSGMNITAQNHSRVALIGTPLTETVFAFYGLNMTGASVSLIYPFDLYDEKQMNSMIEREGITDILISEYYAFPNVMKRLLRDREKLGLRNIILLQSPMGGKYGIPPLEAITNLNRELFREMEDGYLMEDLMKKYEAYPVEYSTRGDSDVVLHTTGTVSGMHKPVPLKDKAMNAFVVCAIHCKNTFDDFKTVPKHLVTYLTLNMSWVYAMVDMLHTPLGLGMEVVSLPFGATNPNYSEAIQHFGINVLFTSKSILDSWLKTMPDIDLSALKVVFMGGTYISPEYKQKFNDYLKSCGSTARIINGYGLSELGGACILAPTDRNDDAIGYPLPGFKTKIYVEDEKRYYDISDGPRTGVLLLSSPTMSTGRLDDTVFFELECVGNEDYLNTHDLVRVNEDGSLTCIGRDNQFFVNNAGIRFDAGLVQNAITAQPGIAACGLVPEFHKMLHDNVPVLYVELNERGLNALNTVHKVLVQVFIKNGMIEESNLPSQVVITDSIPLNTSGKVDSKKLASGSVTGARYSVKPVKMDGIHVTDIMLIPAAEGENATMGAGIPEELEDDCYNILSELFAVIPDLNEGHYSKLFRLPGLRDLVMKLTEFDLNDIPASLQKSTPKMVKMAYKKYMMPLMEGAKEMSKKNSNKWPGFFGMKPPFMPDLDDFVFFGKKTDEWMDTIEDNMFSVWDQVAEMQDNTADTCKKQWKQFFDYMMEMQETVAAFLPDSVPSIPGLPFTVSPKQVASKVKELQEIANEQAVKQADAVEELRRKTNKKVRELVDSTVEKNKKERKERKKKKEEAAIEEVKEEAAAPDEEVKVETVKEEPKKAEPKKAEPKKPAPKAAPKKEEPKKEEPKKAEPAAK